jgi:hypothetical protein
MVQVSKGNSGRLQSADFAHNLLCIDHDNIVSFQTFAQIYLMTDKGGPLNTTN